MPICIMLYDGVPDYCHFGGMDSGDPVFRAINFH